MKGGFENWRLYYPMHTSTKSAMRKKFVDIANRTEFARAVAEYKKGFFLCLEIFTLRILLQYIVPVYFLSDFGIDSLEYPQLLPMIHPKTSGLSMPHASISDSVVHHMGQSSFCSSMLVESAGTLEILD